jgi:hypothetical protein
MEKLSEVGGIEVGFDRNFERRWYWVQRTGWVVMIALLIAGVAGLLGRGPLSQAKTASPDGQIQVSYERLAHFRTPAVIEVFINQNVLQTGQVRLEVNGALMDGVRIQRVIPQPVSTSPLPDGAIFVFPVDATEGQAKITLVQEPGTVGLQTCTVSVNQSASVQFNQFIFP